MAPVELYGMPPSPPYRIASITAQLAGIQVEEKMVNTMQGDQMKPEFLALNPQHTIPTLKDGDFVVTESRAIAGYLANAYDKSGKLYPNDPKVRARVDQRLYYDMGTWFKHVGDCVFPAALQGVKITNEQQKKMKEILGWTQDMVTKTGFAAETNHLTLADVSFIATYSTMEATGAFPCLGEFKELKAWFERCKGLIPNYERVCGGGAQAFGQWYQSKTK